MVIDLLITDTELQQSIWGNLTDRSGQMGYLQLHQPMNAHLHASECAVSFTVLGGTLVYMSSPECEKDNGKREMNQHSCVEEETSYAQMKESQMVVSRMEASKGEPDP